MVNAAAHLDEQAQPATRPKIDTSRDAVLTPELVAARAEDARRQSEEAHAGRFHYQIQLSITGRIRFLSHLETVDTLLGALRRTGVPIALSEGFRPKPKIKVAMPRPVAVEAWNDIVEIELTEQIDVDAFALRLASVLPAGLQLQHVERRSGAYASAASRVVGATWRWDLDESSIDGVRLADAVAQFLASDEVLVERRHPKKATRRVDVRQFVGDMHVVGEGTPQVRAFIRLTDAGSAKPDEVISAIGALSQLELRPGRVTRESITLAEPGSTGGRVVEPALVGADVPDGPEKPWGAC